MWHAHDGMGWWMLFGSVLWILFWISVVYLVVRAVFRPARHDEHTSDAIEIARRRLASGEITPQEYDEIVRHLRAARPYLIFGRRCGPSRRRAPAPGACASATPASCCLRLDRSCAAPARL